MWQIDFPKTLTLSHRNNMDLSVCLVPLVRVWHYTHLYLKPLFTCQHSLSKRAKSPLCGNEVVMWQQERSTFWPEQLCCIQALLKESTYRFKPVIPLVAVYNILQRKAAQSLQKALKNFYFKVLSSVALKIGFSSTER